MDNFGFVITIAGCPYAFATPNVSTLAVLDTSDDWPTGITSERILLGTLDTPNGWTEEIDLPDCTAKHSGQTFRIFDKDIRLLEVANTEVPIATYLFTRNNQEYTLITGSVAVDAEFVGFEPPNIFPDSGDPYPVWIGDECILCEATASPDTLTVVKRGYYGTLDERHYYDPINEKALEVYVDYPGAQRKKVLLWKVDGDSWSVIWRGITGRSPRFSQSSPAIYELQCDHIYGVYASRKINQISAATKIIGHNKNYFSTYMAYWGHDNVQYCRAGDGSDETDTTSNHVILPPRGLSVAMSKSIQKLTELGMPDTTDGYPTLTIDSAVNADTVMMRANLYSQELLNPNNWTLGINLGHRSSGKVISNEKVTPTQYVKNEVSVDGAASLQLFSPIAPTQYLHLERIDFFPPWDTQGGWTTCVRRDVLMTDADDINKNKWVVWFYPSASIPHSAFPSTNKVKGSVSYRREDASRYLAGEEVPYLFAYDANPVIYARQYNSHNWLKAIRYGIAEAIDPRDWDWSNQRDLLANSPSLPTVTDNINWIYKAETEAFYYPEMFQKMTCVAPCLSTDGKIKYVWVHKPLSTTPVVATLGTGDYVLNASPGYTQDNTDMLVSSVVWKSDALVGGDLTINLNNASSKNGKSIELDAAKLTFDARYLGAGPDDIATLARYSNNTIFSTFGVPVEQATITVPLSFWNTITVGSYIRFADNILPDGTGNRAFTGRMAFVKARKLTLRRDARIELTLVMFPENAIYRGYSPCARVNGISDTKLEISVSYIDNGDGGPTDYAGSNLSDYPGTANDGGLYWFRLYDTVQLIKRNTTSLTTFEAIVWEIDPVAKTITLDNPPGGTWEGYIAAGDIVDLRLARSDNPDTQSISFAYVGNGTSGYIPGTTTRNQRYG